MYILYILYIYYIYYIYINVYIFTYIYIFRSFRCDTFQTISYKYKIHEKLTDYVTNYDSN